MIDETEKQPDTPVKGNTANKDGEKDRPAGPDSMKDPPQQWDKVDEEADESFPASDAPSTY